MIALLQNTTSFIYFRVLTIFTGVPELIYILHISSLGQLQGRSDDPQAPSVFLPAHPLFFSGRR